MYVDFGTRIYTIADLSQVWVKLDAYESDLSWIRYGQDVEFVTEAYPGETFHGTIAFIDPILNEKTRTVKVRVNVPNPDLRLKPGMFTRAIVRSRTIGKGKVIDANLAGKWIGPMHPGIVKDEPGNCDICGMPLVSTESLGYKKPGRSCRAGAPRDSGFGGLDYRQTDRGLCASASQGKGALKGAKSFSGPRTGDYYIVKEGLEEGEMVVVQGNFKIDSAIQILAKPSMMNPTGGGPAQGRQHGVGGSAPGGKAPA